MDLDRSFWEKLYSEGQDGWELGEPSPPIATWLDSPSGPRGGTAVVPGCGRGNEVIALAAHGVQTVGIDFAQQAITAGRAALKRAGLEARAELVQLDLFEAPRTLGRRFDLAIEHTAFCAIDPTRRDEYVDVLADLLVPGGRVVGLFYAHGREGGPPFTTDEAEVRRRFGRRFDVERIAVAPNSIERRRNQELFTELRLK
jgi:SAM-dependent methyltransferase